MAASTAAIRRGIDSYSPRIVSKGMLSHSSARKSANCCKDDDGGNRDLSLLSTMDHTGSIQAIKLAKADDVFHRHACTVLAV